MILTQEQEMIRDTMRNFAQERLAPFAAEWDKHHTFPAEALKELGMSDAIDHVTDFTQIAAYGVMTTPALVVDGKVVSFGKVLKKDEVVKILQKVRG